MATVEKEAQHNSPCDDVLVGDAVRAVLDLPVVELLVARPHAEGGAARVLVAVVVAFLGVVLGGDEPIRHVVGEVSADALVVRVVRHVIQVALPPGDVGALGAAELLLNTHKNSLSAPAPFPTFVRCDLHG